jgi:Polyketide cyclase / dehydrase and lipid transport
MPGRLGGLSFQSMAIHLTRIVRAPIEDVFAFFDDFAKTMECNVHAVHLEVVDTQPDGRRTVDVLMGAGARRWTQTIQQVIREPPRRLVTRGGTWTTDRRRWLLTVTTDRRLMTEADGTRVDVTIESRLDQPLRRPHLAILNWLQRGATRREFEKQLNMIGARIEGTPESAVPRSLHHNPPK